MTDVVACGAVVWRRSVNETAETAETAGTAGAAGTVEVLLVHRPRYDDWSFAKGKLDAGETLEDCARREVMEETGFAVELGAALPDVTYIDRKGRPKVVHYWAARVIEDSTVSSAEFIGNDEVDEIRWLVPDQARLLLSYARDAELLTAFAEAVE